MKKIILCTLSASAVFSFILATTILIVKDNAQTIEQCPAGSYEIGRENDKPICKAEPTGCPYGDGIPLDSPKCVPPSAEAYTPFVPAETKPVETKSIAKECK